MYKKKVLLLNIITTKLMEKGTLPWLNLYKKKTKKQHRYQWAFYVTPTGYIFVDNIKASTVMIYCILTLIYPKQIQNI